ncbi:MAG: DNA gyrase subunit A [Candidatus Woykebacteria bacterium RBG_13_40_15]|uniref:DNA gyrase subunit A n=1 Tax=Candidatus Woykebacteria bacterium RBG_13_40_15 TaxID=1802593 RepID=A0A1G1W6T5_9BACT|nr:MAG: DNA gyrase subunit A [Candidatus Woykebacteria bacterium RBG_13_40_15]
MAEEESPIQNIKDKNISVEITDELQRSYLDYAMSVIVSRALPDVKDGLKPVHRRILYAMHELGLTHEAKYRKSATVVGEVLGKYHPHGDSPVYDALVRLAQNFAMRYPLVDGQGNFGSVDGDPPAAMRYTEARMAKISSEMLVDIEKETVAFTDNFDATRKEPLVLPAKLPNLLLNGSAGIAVGMATNIPPHNLNEVCDAIIHLINNPDANVEELMKFIKGPDFPTGGAIFDVNEIRSAYATGKGRVLMRAKAEIEEERGGKFVIIVSEIPYQVNKAQLIAKIAELVKDKKIEGISDLRDESDRKGMRIVIELKRDSRPRSILNNLFKHTAMQLAFNVNIVALVDGVPITLTLKQILSEYIRHRQQVVTKRTQFELDAAKRRLHILEGLKIAVDNLDAVIETIKKSPDAEAAKTNLMKRFKLTEVQAVAILDLQLRRLAALERQKIEDEYKETVKTISYLEALLASPKKILDVIEKELSEIKEKYGDDRRTRVYQQAAGDFSEEDLIPKQQAIVTITKSGYIKRNPVSTFRTQSRGGKGVSGITVKEEDSVANIFSANTHDAVLFFTKSGKVYQLKVYDLPEGSRTAKGSAIVNLIEIDQGDSITAVLNIPTETKNGFLFMVTKGGVVKKTSLADFANIRRSGVIAINLAASDELRFVVLTSGTNEILLVTKNGMSILFSEKDVRAMGRASAGVIGIRQKSDDELIKAEIADPKADFAVVTEKGFGKRTKISDWPRQGRAGSGVKAADVTSRNGKLAAGLVISNLHEDLLITTASGQVIKLPIKDIPILTRQTQGVILIRLNDPNDKVVAVTAIKKERKERITRISKKKD